MGRTTVIALDLTGGRLAGAERRAVPAAARRGPTVGLAGILKLSVLVLALGQLGRLLYSGADVSKAAPVTLSDLVVAVLVVAALLMAVRRRSLYLDAPAFLALAFVAVGFVSTLFTTAEYELSVAEAVFSLAYLGRWVLYFGVYVAAINFIDRAGMRGVWRALELSVLAFAAFGIVQVVFLPEFAQIVQPDRPWDWQGRRLVSTFLDPNFAGGFIALGLLMELSLMAFGVRVPLWKPLLLGAALALTVSRGSILAFTVGLGVLLLARRGISRRMLALGVVGALVFAALFPFVLEMALEYGKLSLDDPSLWARFVTWSWALEVLADHPFFGVGFNTYGFVQREYGFATAFFGLDGGLLFIAVLTGVVGLLLYTGMLTLVVVRCRRTWRNVELDPETRGIALAAAVATVTLVVQSLFLNSLIYPALMETLYVLWAAAFVLGRRSSGAEAATP